MRWIYKTDSKLGKLPHPICSNCGHQCLFTYDKIEDHIEDILTPYCPWCKEPEETNKKENTL